MEFLLREAYDQVALPDYWRTRIQGATLTAIYRPLEQELYARQAVQWDALVLRTTAADIAIMVDAAGARVRIGWLPWLHHGILTRFWFSPPHIYEEWHVEELAGRPIGELHFHDELSPREGGNFYCQYVAIAIGERVLALADRNDMMKVGVEPPTADLRALYGYPGWGPSSV